MDVEKIISHICWVDFSLWLNGLINKSCNNLFFPKSTQPTKSNKDDYPNNKSHCIYCRLQFSIIGLNSRSCLYREVLTMTKKKETNILERIKANEAITILKNFVNEVYPQKTWQTQEPNETGLSRTKLDVFQDFVGGRGCVVRYGYITLNRRVSIAGKFINQTNVICICQ